MQVKVDIGWKTIGVEGERIGFAYGLFEIIHRGIQISKPRINPRIVNRPNRRLVPHLVQPRYIPLGVLSISCASFDKASPGDGVWNVGIEVFGGLHRAAGGLVIAQDRLSKAQ